MGEAIKWTTRLYDLFNGTTDGSPGTTIHTRTGFVRCSGRHNGRQQCQGVRHQLSGRRVELVAHSSHCHAAWGGRVRIYGSRQKAHGRHNNRANIVPLPPDLTHSQFTLLDEIRDAQNNYIGAGAYWIENFFYNNHLRSGAMAVSRREWSSHYRIRPSPHCFDTRYTDDPLRDDLLLASRANPLARLMMHAWHGACASRSACAPKREVALRRRAFRRPPFPVSVVLR